MVCWHVSLSGTVVDGIWKLFVRLRYWAAVDRYVLISLLADGCFRIGWLVMRKGWGVKMKWKSTASDMSPRRSQGSGNRIARIWWQRVEKCVRVNVEDRYEIWKASECLRSTERSVEWRWMCYSMMKFDKCITSTSIEEVRMCILYSGVISLSLSLAFARVDALSV